MYWIYKEKQGKFPDLKELYSQGLIEKFIASYNCTEERAPLSRKTLKDFPEEAMLTVLKNEQESGGSKVGVQRVC